MTRGKKTGEYSVFELQGIRNFKETGGEDQRRTRKVRTERGPLDVVIKRSLGPCGGSLSRVGTKAIKKP